MIEVHIGEPDILRRKIKIAILERGPQVTTFHLPDGSGWATTNEGVQPDENIWWEMPSAAAHALLGALSRHLGAVEHPEQLRSDYMAERARVDRLIGHITGGSQ